MFNLNELLLKKTKIYGSITPTDPHDNTILSNPLESDPNPAEVLKQGYFHSRLSYTKGYLKQYQLFSPGQAGPTNKSRELNRSDRCFRLYPCLNNIPMIRIYSAFITVQYNEIVIYSILHNVS